MANNQGRLELTWTNKHLTLFAGEEGGYEWVDPTDVRVAETRLLDEVAVVGDVGSQRNRAADNLLIRGDSLQALRSLRHLPEFADGLVGKVKLVYIDPPFNTGQAFVNYDDALEHSVWLTMMRDRLMELKRLLAVDGTIWIHLDDAEVHRMRCVLEEVFGAANFVTQITWQRTVGATSSPQFSRHADFLLVAAKNTEVWRSNRLPHAEKQLSRYANPDDDPRGPWQGDNYAQNKTREQRPGGWYPITRPSDGMEIWPNQDAVWRFERTTHETNVAEGRVWWGADGRTSRPRYKRFLSEVDGITASNVWLAAEVDRNRHAKEHIKRLFPDVAVPFATPKPERLMERIVHIATDPGDVVLDCFAGSGTTAAVAHKMGRRWVTIEREAETVVKFTRPRLEKVVAGDDPGGITESAAWEGGGGYRVFEVADSMYEIDDDGEVFLSESATNGRFAEAVRAQLGFEADDEPPFCGRKGRARLAVFDGAVGVVEAEHLVGSLGESDRLVLVAKAVDPDVEALFAERSPGSKIRKAPRDLLRSAGRVVR